MRAREALQRSAITDPALAPQGEKAISWVEAHAPVLRTLARNTLTDGSLTGRRVAVVVHLEAKTAYLAALIAEAGAEVVVAGSNPSSTRDDVAAALVARGIEVHAREKSTVDEWAADLLAVADTEPEFVIDDGVELTMQMAEHRPAAFEKLLGVTEETTTGIARLRALDTAGRLPFPAITANDALCKHRFDNKYGTGLSTLSAIFGLTNMLIAGACVVVVGYGWVGNGLATYAKGLGARVVVIEVDPVRALEAVMDGHEVAPAATALPQADFVITATGGVRAIGSAHFPLLNNQVVLANAGHHDLEIDVEAIEAQASHADEVRDGVVQYTLPGGKQITVLTGGSLVNIAGGRGHPIEIMDLSFSVQALALHYLASGALERGVHPFPRVLDEKIAATCLAQRGIVLDALTEDQRERFHFLDEPPL